MIAALTINNRCIHAVRCSENHLRCRSIAIEGQGIRQWGHKGLIQLPVALLKLRPAEQAMPAMTLQGRFQHRGFSEILPANQVNAKACRKGLTKGAVPGFGEDAAAGRGEAASHGRRPSTTTDRSPESDDQASG